MLRNLRESFSLLAVNAFHFFQGDNTHVKMPRWENDSFTALIIFPPPHTGHNMDVWAVDFFFHDKYILIVNRNFQDTWGGWGFCPKCDIFLADCFFCAHLAFLGSSRILGMVHSLFSKTSFLDVLFCLVLVVFLCMGRIFEMSYFLRVVILCCAGRILYMS